MATGTSLPDFPSFDIDKEPTSLGTLWKKWITRLKNLFIAIDVTDPQRKKAMMLHYAGGRVTDIFYTLAVEHDTCTYDEAQKALDDYFEPLTNITYESYSFREITQRDDETIDQFVTRLREAATRCDFHDSKREIKDQIVSKGKSVNLRRKALREDPTLDDLLKAARAMEISEHQASKMEENVKSSVHKLQDRERPEYSERGKKCFNCGGDWPHTGRPCPAMGKKCKKCGRKDHFASQCRRRRKAPGDIKKVKDKAEGSGSSDDEVIKKVSSKRAGSKTKVPVKEKEDSSDSDAYIYKLPSDDSNKRRAHVKVKVNNTLLNMQIDSGADRNVISRDDFKVISARSNITLRKAKINLYPYGSRKPLPLLGKFEALVETKEKILVSWFYVIDSQLATPLLSMETATSLGVLKIISNVTSHGRNRVKNLVEEYDHIFHGIGKLKDVEVKLHVDKSITPVAQKHRPIPLHLRARVETELERLEEAGVIESVEGPTDWVSPLVITPKKGGKEIRVCVDMRRPNEAIKRTRHVIPTIDELRHEFNGATVYSKLDLKDGYHQLELDEESRNITTFSTHVGLKRYRRLNFGTNSASEVFHEELRKTISGIKNVRNIHDDIIIYGKNVEEHNIALSNVFKRLSENGLTLKKDKCEFLEESIEFFGFIFSKQGMSPSPTKVQALKDVPPPSNITELKSFLGMANYSSRFIPHFSTISAPLRNLFKKEAEWKWDEEEQNAFDEIKNNLKSGTVMCHFDVTKQSKVLVDASPFGLGAMLIQDSKAVAYASRSLTKVERRYSQIERECLAIRFGCQRFRMYLMGSKFEVHTDHQPLVPLFNNPNKIGPTRIERMRLRLQEFCFTVAYQRGDKNPTDYMSRHPMPLESCSDSEQAVSEENEAYINLVVGESVLPAMTIDEVKEHYGNDGLLNEIALLLRDDVVPKKNPRLKSFSRIWDELSLVDGVVLRGDRVVLPKALYKKAVKLSHEAHLGIVKSKQFLRSRVWFPGMDVLVEEAVKSCHPCQAAVETPCQEPLAMSELPNGPWENVSVDYCSEILPNGEYLLVVIDNYSRYPVVEFVSSTSARVLIPRLDNILATFGIPLEIKSDNGPPFTSTDVENYAIDKGFFHRLITPLWPKANSQAENIMKIFEKIVRVATLEKKNVKQEIHKFLLNYRATPHASTGVSPASLMFQGRQFRTKLPEILRKYEDENVRRKDQEAKQKMKQYADRKSYVKFSHLQVGDPVLVRQRRKRKLDTPYNPTPYKIIMKKGSMVTAEARGGHRITRNVSFFKHLIQDDSDDLERRNSSSGNRGDTDILTPEDEENIPAAEEEIVPEEDEAPMVVEERRYPRRDRSAPPYLASYET